MSKRITINFNDHTSKSYNIFINWQSNEMAHKRNMEKFYAPVSFMLEKIALDSGHGVPDISSFIVNGSKLKANPWEFITVQNPEPRDFFFSELAIDELSRTLGIRGD